MAEKRGKKAKLDALERMLVIRRFEEEVDRLFHDDEAFMTHYHLYIGQESTGVALMDALGPDDKIATHHRNHGHVLARGSEPKLALAEILGREAGLNKGAGGTLHMSDPSLGFISTSAIVGGSISLATGAGFAMKQEDGDGIAVGLFGDGALEEGIAYESLNLASLWTLPVLYFCENNSPGALGSAGGGFPTSVSAVKDLTDIPKTFDIPVETVDGRSVDDVYKVTSKAVKHCRAGKGPFFVHAVTDRWAGSQGLWPSVVSGALDISMAWDDSKIKGEHADWFKDHDPVLIYARALLKSGDVTEEELTEMDERATSVIAEAREFALESPRPSPESALDNVFA